MNRTRSKKILTVAIIVTLAVIWGHSLLGREASSEESSFVMELLTPLLEVVVGKGNVTEHLVRKLAHFCEFFVYGIELQLFFDLSKNKKNAFLLALTGIVDIGTCFQRSGVDPEISQLADVRVGHDLECQRAERCVVR